MEKITNVQSTRVRVKIPGTDQFLDVLVNIERGEDEFKIEIKYLPELSLGVEQGKGGLELT